MSSKIRAKFLAIRRQAIAEKLTSTDWDYAKDHRSFHVQVGKRRICIFYNAELFGSPENITAMDCNDSRLVSVLVTSLADIKNYEKLVEAWIVEAIGESVLKYKKLLDKAQANYDNALALHQHELQKIA